MNDSSPKGAYISTPDDLWTYRRMVSWLECPHLRTQEKRKRRENIISTYGIDSPWIQSMLFGRFIRPEASSRIFEPHHIEAAKRAMRRENVPIKGPPMASIDFSGGVDAQALMFGEGTDIHSAEDRHEPNEIILAKQLVTRFKGMGLQPFNVMVDGGGLGSTCIKYMETDLGFVGIRKYLNNKRARLPKVFADRYTEDHFRLRQMLVLNMLQLPNDEELLKQMRNRQYVTVDNNTKLKTEPKDKIRARGMRSPDLLDDLVMITTDVIVEGFEDLHKEDKKDNIKTWEEQAREKTGEGNRLGPMFGRRARMNQSRFGPTHKTLWRQR